MGRLLVNGTRVGGGHTPRGRRPQRGRCVLDAFILATVLVNVGMVVRLFSAGSREGTTSGEEGGVARVLGRLLGPGRESQEQWERARSRTSTEREALKLELQGAQDQALAGSRRVRRARPGTRERKGRCGAL